ncbi:TonB-dependent receptor [Maricurvus nonylphenolicus]|uniref:TonB-dependent receptor n=1 Tax=Maricurvus nonylphenolicus TaxID=1008307 RepID=UPI0036F38049
MRAIASKLNPLALSVAFIATPALAQDFVLEEIVVTAQKRAESLQDVPISVSAMSGDKIAEAGIPSMNDFSAYVPNFNVTSNAIGDVISIRGIQSGILASIEQSVGTFVDGVYRGRGTQSRFSFLDVGMIEVLRGPQSTLFGKNTIGGALNITSAAPTEEFQAEISGLYEVEHDETEIKGYVSGPLSDSVRGRLAILDRQLDDGWIENTYYDSDEPQTDETAGRLSLEWDASDDVLVKFKYEYGEWDNKLGYDQEILTPQLSGVLTGLGADTQPGNFTTTIGNNTAGIDYGAAQTFEGDSQESALRIDYTLPKGTLTAIAGYSEYEFERNLDADFNALDGMGFEEAEDYEQTSLEVRFVSELGNGFEFITGLYYQDSELNFAGKSNFNVNSADPDSFGPVAIGAILQEANVLGTAPLLALLDADSSGDLSPAEAQVAADAIGQFTRANVMEQETESWAVFTQGTWDLSDELRLTLGARYGEEEREAKQGVNCADWDTTTTNNTAANCGAFSLLLAEFTPHQFNDLSRDEEHWTYTANIQWDLTEDIMVYATMSNGVKSGGFNSFALTDNTDEAEFDEEKVKSFEVGAKMSLLDGQAEVNFAVFDMDYDDLQATIFTGATGFKVENAASASIQGIEIDGRWQLTEELMLRGSLGYVDFEFDEYDNAGCTAAQRSALGFVGLFTRPAPGTTVGNATAVGTNAFGQAATCEQDLSGGTSAYTPEISASLSLEHEMDLGSSLFLRTVADVNYMDDHHTAQDNDELVYQDAYATVNLTVTLGAQDDKWDISLVGRNLTDEEFITYSNDMPLFAGSQQVSWSRGANYAIRGRLKY